MTQFLKYPVKLFVIFTGILIILPDFVCAGRIKPPIQILSEIPTKVILSNRDINRFTCMGGRPVKDIIYSTEKGVKVKIEGSDAFAKFLVLKNNSTGKTKVRTKPVEFYVVCGEGDIYTIIGLPRNISARHVQLTGEKKDKIKKNLSLFKGIPFEKKIIMVIQSAYNNDIPESFTVKKIGKLVSVFRDIDVFLNRQVVADGEGVVLNEYILSLNPACKYNSLKISEKDFLVPELATNPTAIALESLILKKGSSKRLFVVQPSGVQKLF